MKTLVTIEAFGFEPVPWSVPNICSTRTKTGKFVRFSKRPKKSDIDKGKLSLEHWQTYVRQAAVRAMKGVTPPTGPIRLRFEFYARTPQGRRHGELWDAPLKFHPDTGDFGKAQPRGKAEADICNLVKGTEDALAEVVFPNDVQTRLLSAITLFGPDPGVRIFVHAMEASDYPGRGEPVE